MGGLESRDDPDEFLEGSETQRPRDPETQEHFRPFSDNLAGQYASRRRDPRKVSIEMVDGIKVHWLRHAIPPITVNVGLVSAGRV